MTVSFELNIDGRTNMARDAEMLRRARSAARVYTWDGPWVSLGRFQRPERAIKNPTKIDWIVRPTGGKAVLHGHDVTVSIAAKLDDIGVRPDEARRVSTVYRAIVQPLVVALNASGLQAVIAENTAHVKTSGHTADCFAYVSPNDVVDPHTGEKLCGCALRVTDSAVLLQASVPVGPPIVDPSEVFDNPHVPQKIRDLDPERLAAALRTISLAPLVVK